MRGQVRTYIHTYIRIRKHTHTHTHTHIHTHTLTYIGIHIRTCLPYLHTNVRMYLQTICTIQLVCALILPQCPPACSDGTLQTFVQTLCTLHKVSLESRPIPLQPSVLAGLGRRPSHPFYQYKWLWENGSGLETSTKWPLLKPA